MYLDQQISKEHSANTQSQMVSLMPTQTKGISWAVSVTTAALTLFLFRLTAQLLESISWTRHPWKELPWRKLMTMEWTRARSYRRYNRRGPTWGWWARTTIRSCQLTIMISNKKQIRVVTAKQLAKLILKACKSGSPFQPRLPSLQPSCMVVANCKALTCRISCQAQTLGRSPSLWRQTRSSGS